MKNLVRSFVCLLVFAAVGLAQNDRGTVTGTVTDPTDATVPGAKLVLRNTETGALSETQTTPTGNYTFTSLPVGTYDLTVQAAGFKTEVEKQLAVQIDQTLRLDVKLEVGSATESVTVSATAEMLKTENAEQSMNVSGQKLNELPINFGGSGTAGGGIRNWLTFTYLAPGVAGTGAGSEVNGLPGGNYKVYLEGQDSTSPVAVGWTSTVQSASVEAITEFTVQSSNFSAEYGQVLGGLYNFTTKSGTNQFHGSAYEEWTNEVLERAPSLESRQEQGPAERLRLLHRRPGAGFPKSTTARTTPSSSSTWKGTATTRSSSSDRNVPTAAYRQGDFSCALYAHHHQLHRPDGDPHRSDQRISVPAESDFRSPQHLHGRQRPPDSHRLPQQCDPAEPHGSGGPEDPGPDTGADQHPDHAELGSQHRHANEAADPQPEDRSEFWIRTPR